MNKATSDLPRWKQQPDKRGADFRIVRPGEGEGRSINHHALLSSLAESKPLPSPLFWTASLSSQIVAVNWKRQNGDFARAVEYKVHPAR